jgi:hypothetical protein
MDGLLQAYFSGVHNCEVVQEDFEHLNRTRYRIIGEAVDKEAIKNIIAKGAKKAGDPQMSRGDVEKMRKSQREQINGMANEELLHEMPYQIWGPPSHGSSNAEPVPLGKPYKNKKRAKNKADKLDLEIGGYRHRVREVPDNNVNEEAVIEYLVSEGYAKDDTCAIGIYEAMSDEWLGVIIEKLSKADQRIIDNRILSKHADALEKEISKLTRGNTQPAPGQTRPRKKLTYEVK